MTTGTHPSLTSYQLWTECDLYTPYVQYVKLLPYYTHTRHVYIHVLVCVCVFCEGFYLVSESRTLRLHTNQEEEYPAIMREYGVLKNPFTTIHVLQYTEPFQQYYLLTCI